MLSYHVATRHIISCHVMSYHVISSHGITDRAPIPFCDVFAPTASHWFHVAECFIGRRSEFQEHYEEMAGADVYVQARKERDVSILVMKLLLLQLLYCLRSRLGWYCCSYQVAHN